LEREHELHWMSEHLEQMLYPSLDSKNFEIWSAKVVTLYRNPSRREYPASSSTKRTYSPPKCIFGTQSWSFRRRTNPRGSRMCLCRGCWHSPHGMRDSQGRNRCEVIHGFNQNRGSILHRISCRVRLLNHLLHTDDTPAGVSGML